MPKIRMSDNERRLKKSWSVVEAGMYRNGINQKDLSKKLGLSEPTLSKKKHNSDTFTASDIRNIAITLKLSNREIIELIGLNYIRDDS